MSNIELLKLGASHYERNIWAKGMILLILILLSNDIVVKQQAIN